MNLSTTDIQFTDPTLDYESTGWQIEYATALKLLNWKEAKAQLVPEAATSFPRVAGGGLTYTFTIRKSLRLSDGSKVTAANFKAAFDRVTDPKMQSPALAFLGDLKSVSARGMTLTLRLSKPRPDFGSIISMPFFQAIPVGLPHDPQGVKTYASGGPYYICDRQIGRSVHLCRNRFYKGKRAAEPKEIAITVLTNFNTSLLQIEKNEVDYEMLGVPGPQVSHLHNAYPRQFHVKPGNITAYLALNTTYGSRGRGKSIFDGYSGAGLRTRKAVNYALDRPAILKTRGAFGGQATSQLLPPTMPGYHRWKLYPTGKPNLRKAKSLKPRKGTAVIYALALPDATVAMEIVKADLSRIGINAEIKQFEFSIANEREGHRGEPFDLAYQAWSADYPDPVDFIDILLDGRNIQAEHNNNTAYFNNEAFNQRMALAGRLIGSKRYTAWAAIDRDVMKQQAPLAPLFYFAVREFTSKRLIGCYTYQPIYGAMNLNTACINRH